MSDGPDYRCDLNAAKQAVDGYLAQHASQTEYTRRFHYLAIQRFLIFVEACCHDQRGNVVIAGNLVWRWMRYIRNTISQQESHETILSVARFMEALQRGGLLVCNPFAAIYAQYGTRGWKGINAALGFEKATDSLGGLRRAPRFTGSLGRLMESYLALRRAMGGKHKSAEAILAEFNRFARDHDIQRPDAIDAKTVLDWLTQMDVCPSSRRAKSYVLHNFMAHLLSLGELQHNPVTPQILDSTRVRKRAFVPYIFSHDEIRAVLHAARRMDDNRRFKHKGQILHLILAMLYTLGLRIQEALNLSIRDVDFGQSVLFIRRSKFYKERLVPFGPRMAACLSDYVQVRQRLFTPIHPDDPLFVAQRRRPVATTTVLSNFRSILARRGIDACRRQHPPRLHDLRHTFAVHRLLRWYQEGADVQSKLTFLSVFMGHVEITYTQVYLTITGSLLDEASKRFCWHFGASFEQEYIE